ncbi:caspase family protein [Streptomyces sp. NPDC006386]|uniref:caspase family protein n=1 Tax=Streptomyces sp. NPDC006386 TaxID=3156762 RepID=UPI0033BEC85C
MGEERALVVAVGTFRSAVASGDEPPVGGQGWDALDFVYKVLPEVQQALEHIGYTVDVVRDPSLTEVRLAVADALDGDHRVLHVMSHGVAGMGHDPNRLDMIASDSRTGVGSNVTDWVSAAQASGKPTLFLLDLCRSGVAARLPFMGQLAGRDTYAWVIAAAGGSEDAFDGRFSQAVSEILEESSRTGLGTSPTQPYVSFSLLARRIGERLGRMPGLPQTIHATPLDPSHPEPELPFVPNPLFVWDPSLAAHSALDGPLRAFVDEPTALRPQDSAHFANKAGRHFTGRRSQLALLAPWLDGIGSAGLCLVTGRPGTGKSALIGAVVGAAHPTLVEAAPHIRARLQTDPAGCPSINRSMAAVHARQRELDDLVTSLARQLRLDGPPDGWSPKTFVEAVTASDVPPTLVVDALDEANEPARVTDELLLPLACSRRPDGGAACRLLVGARPWEEFAALQRAAADGGLLIDLNVTDPLELRQDVRDYLAISLADIDGYASGSHRAVRDRLSTAAADSLVDASDQEWGAFLVASVFVRYLAAVPAPGTEHDAALLGGTVPHHLHAVFDLDLRARPNSTAARALLSAFAFAKGDGMPAELAMPLAESLVPGVTSPELHEALSDVLFYLRTDVELDGTTLYRPFHQGLADYLVAENRNSTPAEPVERLVLDVLLGCAGQRSETSLAAWSTAPPYLLRHAVQHARDCNRQDELFTDAEFLVHADPATVIPALAMAETDAGRLAVAVYRASSGSHRHADARIRRQLLAIDAARYGARPLLGRLNAGAPPDAWIPRWATGSQVDSALLDTLTGHVDAVTSIAVTETTSMQRVAVTAGDDGTIRLWDLASRQLLKTLGQEHASGITAVLCLKAQGTPYVVAADQADRLQVWDAVSGTLVGTPHGTGQERILGLSAVETDDGAVIVAAGESSLGFYAISLQRGGPSVSKIAERDLACTAVACTRLGDRRVAVVATRNSGIQIWDVDTTQMSADPFGVRLSAPTAVACTMLDQGPVAVVTTRQSGIWMWDLASRQVLGKPFGDRLSAATSVTCAVAGGRPIAVTTSDDGTVRRWDLRTRTAVGDAFVGHTDWVRAVAVTTVRQATEPGSPGDDQLIALSVSDDSTVRIWDMTPRLPVGRPVTGHRATVQAVATTVVGERAIALTAAEDDPLNIWGMEHGEHMGLLDGYPARALTCTRLGSRPAQVREVAVTSGASRVIRFWNLATHRLVGRMSMRHDRAATGLAVTRIRERPVLLSCTRGGEIRAWDLENRVPLSRAVPGHRGAATGVAAVDLQGRPHAVTCGDDGIVRLWDLASRVPKLVAALLGHTGGVTAVACTEVGSLPVAVSTGYDRTVRVWDLTTKRQLGDPLRGHNGGVLAVVCAAVRGRPTALTSGEDSTVRLWDLEHRTVETLALPMPANALTVAPDGCLVMGCGPEVIVMERPEAW